MNREHYDKIKQLVETKPKHFSRIIQRDAELFAEIEKVSGNTVPEKIYNYLHNTTGVCRYGRNMKLRSITEGYAGCGKASVCQCTKEAVAASVSKAKQECTLEQTAAINKKRSETNKRVYGVENSGQTASAKQAHAEVYSNKSRVADINKKIRDTKTERYNSPTYNNSEQTKATYKKKYDKYYWAERLDNENILVLRDKDQVYSLYQKYNPQEIACLLKVHIQTVYRYLNLYGFRKPYVSFEEQDVVNYIESLGITNIVRNTRKLLPSGREIDIYLPDKKIAIEYNGLFWHHEDIPHITRTYHKEKYDECASLGIQLITIFSNFWLQKKEVVKKTLAAKLGKAVAAVYARRCEIRTVPTRELKAFLNENHVQGYTTSSINYGLYYNDNLVSVMTFGCKRIAIGKPDSGYELIRHASSVRVVGGASKLLAHFIKMHSPKMIFSYSDNEWSNGNLYSKLGFTLASESSVSFRVFDPKKGKLYHRLKFAKFKLIEIGCPDNLTAREITRELGLLRIWDCGKKRWVLDLDQ